MKLLYLVYKNDLKLIFRDKSLMIMFIIPVAMIFICRLGVPQIADLVSGLPDFYWLIVAALSSVSAATPSYLFGFVLLDERDENVHTLLRILPLPVNFILKSRVIFMFVMGFVFSVLILGFNGIIRLSFIEIIAISVLFAFIPPILTFTIVSFAKNKIEAATLYKALNMFLFLPLAAFFIHGKWHFLFGIIPFFWTFKTIQLIGKPETFVFYFLLSLLIHGLLIFILYRVYKRKTV